MDLYYRKKLRHLTEHKTGKKIILKIPVFSVSFAESNNIYAREYKVRWAEHKETRDATMLEF